jgi:hypothetical protein
MIEGVDSVFVKEIRKPQDDEEIRTLEKQSQLFLLLFLINYSAFVKTIKAPEIGEHYELFLDIFNSDLEVLLPIRT